MAWFDRNPGGKKEPEPQPEKVPEAVKPVPVPEPAPVVTPKPKVEPVLPALEADLVGHLYKGSRVSGQLVFQGSAKIDGIVDGEVRCNGTLTIGAGAEVRAKISGQAVVIQGKVEGNVTAREKVELTAPARLYGNISSPRLVITEGVVFDGECSMGVAKPKTAVASSQGVSTEKIAVAQAPKLRSDSEK
jgi:cytoskeletal protein CcmA (bactofilin family)